MARKNRKRMYGAGTVVPPRNTGGTWSIRWREGKRRRSQGGFTTRDMAERVLARIAGEAALGRAGLPPDPKTAATLGVAAEPFLARRELTHRAGKEDGYRWKKHLSPHFGHLRPA